MLDLESLYATFELILMFNFERLLMIPSDRTETYSLSAWIDPVSSRPDKIARPIIPHPMLFIRITLVVFGVYMPTRKSMVAVIWREIFLKKERSV